MITIEKYKNFQNSKFPISYAPGDWTVIEGASGSGRTSLLEAAALTVLDSFSRDLLVGAYLPDVGGSRILSPYGSIRFLEGYQYIFRSGLLIPGGFTLMYPKFRRYTAAPGHISVRSRFHLSGWRATPYIGEPMISPVFYLEELLLTWYQKAESFDEWTFCKQILENLLHKPIRYEPPKGMLFDDTLYRSLPQWEQDIIGLFLDIVASWIHFQNARHREESYALETIQGIVFIDRLDVYWEPSRSLDVFMELRRIFKNLTFVVTSDFNKLSGMRDMSGIQTISL